MNVTVYQQNPMFNLKKIVLNQQNPKIQKVRKYPLNAWRYGNKNKRMDKMVLPALGEENLAKLEEENDKKFECILAKSEREKKLKNFWKWCLKQSKNCF